MADHQVRDPARAGKPHNQATWRHEEIAALLARLRIKTSGGFLERDPAWSCPGCGRSKAQIVAPGRGVDVVACIFRHHDHIEDLISRLLSEATGPCPVGPAFVPERLERQLELQRRFCRFAAVDVCQACNNVDATAKSIVRAPSWFSFSPHGIRNMIQPPKPYVTKHEIDRYRLSLIWDKVSGEIQGLEDRIRSAIRDLLQGVA